MRAQSAKLSRSILPIPDRTHIGLTTYDAKDPNSKFPPIEPLLPPKGAPNVLVVLLDDVGFAASSAFGGPCTTPNFDKLASNGLKYNRFHTTALCSPTRQALLTGRNHHSVGMGGVTEIATSAPATALYYPRTKPAAPADSQAERLLDGTVWEVPRSAGVADNPMGPFDQMADAAEEGLNISTDSSVAKPTSL